MKARHLVNLLFSVEHHVELLLVGEHPVVLGRVLALEGLLDYLWKILEVDSFFADNAVK